MKAITLHQPWASLVAVGAKTVETRSWKPPCIGERIAIQAGKNVASLGSLHPGCRQAAIKLKLYDDIPPAP